MTTDAQLYDRPLFAFGTLQDADVFKLVTGGLEIEFFAKADAWLADHCAHGVHGGLYPVLQRAPGMRAPGTLLFGLSAQTIDRLVWFETPEFEPCCIEVATAERVLHSTVFRAASAPRSLEPVWSLDRWRIHKKAEWLREAQRWVTASQSGSQISW